LTPGRLATMSPPNLSKLRAEQEEVARQTQRTIGLGEEMLERAREVAHKVEERILHALRGGERTPRQAAS